MIGTPSWRSSGNRLSSGPRRLRLYRTWSVATSGPPGRAVSSFMSGMSKLLTPQYLISPACCRPPNVSIVSASGTRPRQCSRYRSIRSVPSRRRLPSQAATVPRVVACCGSTLDTRNTSSRRPAMASPTSLSASPSAYISAVSITVMPRSRPRRSARISSSRRAATSARCQVPCPSTGIRSPDGSFTVRMVVPVPPRLDRRRLDLHDHRVGVVIVPVRDHDDRVEHDVVRTLVPRRRHQVVPVRGVGRLLEVVPREFPEGFAHVRRPLVLLVGQPVERLHDPLALTVRMIAVRALAARVIDQVLFRRRVVHPVQVPLHQGGAREPFLVLCHDVLLDGWSAVAGARRPAMPMSTWLHPPISPKSPARDIPDPASGSRLAGLARRRWRCADGLSRRRPLFATRTGKRMYRSGGGQDPPQAGQGCWAPLGAGS